MAHHQGMWVLRLHTLDKEFHPLSWRIPRHHLNSRIHSHHRRVHHRHGLHGHHRRGLHGHHDHHGHHGHHGRRSPLVRG